MDDAGFMSMVQSVGDGGAEFERFANGQRVGFDPIGEIGTIDEFTGDVDQPVFSSDFVDVILNVNLVLFMVVLLTVYLEKVESRLSYALKRLISYLRWRQAKRTH